MIVRNPYYKKNQKYVNFKFDSELKAKAFRAICKMFGINADAYGKTNNYKTVVYINSVDYRD